MKSFQSQTHYEVLEVSVGATGAEIRSAYERLVRLYGDDQVVLYGLIDPARAEQLRDRLKQALDVLTDDARRDEYDRKIGLPPREKPAPPPRAPPAPPSAPSAPSTASAGWGSSFSWVSAPVPVPAVSAPTVFTVSRPAPPPVSPIPAPHPSPPPAVVEREAPPPAPSSPPADAGPVAAPAPEPAPAPARPSPPAAVHEPLVAAPPATAPVEAPVVPVAQVVVAEPPVVQDAPAETGALPAEPGAPSNAPAEPASAPVEAVAAAEGPAATIEPAPPAPLAVPEEPATPRLSDDAQVSIVPARSTPAREFRAEPKPKPYEVPAGVEFNGDLLRQVRMARGLSLAQLSERTRISVRHLENVEGDRYDALPAVVYLRGILMNLARELGLDGLRVSKSYLAFVEAGRSKG